MELFDLKKKWETSLENGILLKRRFENKVMLEYDKAYVRRDKTYFNEHFEKKIVKFFELPDGEMIYYFEGEYREDVKHIDIFLKEIKVY